MASAMYLEGMADMFKGDLDWEVVTLKCALVTAAYTFDCDHSGFAAITNELSGTGYTGGGDTLTTPAVNTDTVNDRVELDADDAAWTAINAGTAAAAIIYDSTNDSLIAYIDIADTATNGGDLTIEWDAEGIIQFPS